MPKTAIVFSAGGMFGAWQVGAWKVLARHIEPDLIVGASIGSLNGWAVAGGCTPQDLERYWLELSGAEALRFRLPRSPLHGWMDTRHLEQRVRRLHADYRPEIDYAVILTDLLKLRPRIFRGPDLTAEHLLASCAVPLVLDQQRIDGRIYTDGGLLNTLPVWAAASLGATRVIALNALPQLPSTPLRLANRAVRRMAGWRGPVLDGVETLTIAPSSPLGTIREVMEWKRERIEDWIARGEEDALAALSRNKTFASQMF